MEYGLIGEKLGHSYSKLIQEKLINNYTYELHPIDKEYLDTFMKEKDFKAINVTIPYKEKVLPYLDELDLAAKKIGAVNTIVNNNNSLKGYNTDYYGFKYMLIHHNIKIDEQKVLIIGNGGACKAIYALIKDLKAKEILITSRTIKDNVLPLEDIYKFHTDVDVIINTSPVGMYPNVESSPISLNVFNNIKACIDIVYNPYCTTFILEALEKGIMAINGLEMLVSQAKYALEYFKDISIKEEEIDRIYKEILLTTTNMVCFNKEEGQIAAKQLNKQWVNLEEKKQEESLLSLVKQYGIMNNLVIYIPKEEVDTNILYELKRNGIFSDNYKQYEEIIKNM